jgi:phosphoserine phosphatase
MSGTTSMSSKINLILIALLLISGFLNVYQKKEKEIYKNLVDEQFKQRYVELEQKLKQSEQQRLVLGDSIINLNIHREATRKLIIKQDEELKKIKGRYDKRTPSELELEMERRTQ